MPELNVIIKTRKGLFFVKRMLNFRAGAFYLLIINMEKY